MKKTLLLASMALALVAFAAPPAQAEVPLWYHNEEPISGVEELHIEGTIASTVIGGGGLVIGPCEITLEGTAENVNGMAHATITNGIIQEHCETNVEGCTFTPTLENFPWTATGTTITGQKGLEIGELTVTKHFSGGCPIPVSTLSVVGSLTGIVNDEGCLSFENHLDDLFLETQGLPALRVDIFGAACDTTLTLG